MLSRTTENYLRVISELIDKKGYARSNDISSILGVSAPSVTQMLQKLARANLIHYEKRGPVTLTSDGNKLASSIKMRYQVFVKLFEMAGVSKKTAYMDACYLEHQLSEETVTKLVSFVNKIESSKEI